jgi:glycosyltransferase involved in cell wall biosynthesis
VFSRTEAPEMPSDTGWASPWPSIYWFSQTIGPQRGIECAIQAIAVARSEPCLYLRGQFAVGYEAQVDALARSLGCRDRLRFLDPAPPPEMARLAARHDLGLASEIGHTPNNDRALSNKLFTYFLAGLPVLLSDTPAQARFSKGKEACVRLYQRENPAALAAAIDEFLLDPIRLATARRAAFELGQNRYNWEVEQRYLLELVGNALL